MIDYMPVAYPAAPPARAQPAGSACYLNPPIAPVIPPRKDLTISRVQRSAISELRYYGVYKGVAFVVSLINCESVHAEVALTLPPSLDLDVGKLLGDFTAIFGIRQARLPSPADMERLYTQRSLEFRGQTTTTTYRALEGDVLNVITMTVETMA